ncbi:hypothetical protein JHD48_08470 [Sulfurimonas sp. SAG-AH-194-I05]|nr:tetratricopeptide repeat protein [Sulfurimonas sp. SAG-AH-194-I05]MDF1875768.1 hypothetical protein [Sulfurimonas sp. SAG-AH-194-I05]
MKNQSEINKAIKFYEQGKYDKAIKIAKKLLKQDASNEELLRLLVMSSGESGDIASKKKYLLKLVKFVQDPTVFQTLALLFQEEGSLDKAKIYYEKALELDPTYAKCYLYLSLIYSLEYNFDKAEELVARSIELKKGSSDVYESYHFLAMLYDSQEEFIKALEIFIELIKLNYEDIDMRFNFSLLCLKLNKYQEGFDFFRYRYHPEYSNPMMQLENVPILEKGIAIAGKNIVVTGEQGAGEAIQFMRYIPLLIQEKANVTVVVGSLVIPLFKASYPEVKCIDTFEHIDYDYNIPIADLAYLFNSDYNNIPFKDTYIQVNEEESQKINEKFFLNERKKKVGIVWRSNQGVGEKTAVILAQKRENTNMTLLQCIKYFKNDDVQLYSLQVSVTKEERELLELHNIPSLGDDFVSFYDNALVIDNLDVVIAINTTSALISGAMGKRTILLLSDNSDWRWGIKEDKNNWYNSLEILRQVKREGWDSLLERSKII